MIRIVIAALALAVSSLPAFAYCSEPSAPYGKPTRPDTPYCVNTFTNTHTCDDWEIDRYNSEIRSFKSDYETYVRRLRDYVDEAVEYAECQVRSLNN